MKKWLLYAIVPVLVLCGAIGGYQFRRWQEQKEILWLATPIPIEDVTEKQQIGEEYFLTVTLSSSARRYLADSGIDSLTLRAEKSVFDQVTCNTGYAGASLLFQFPPELTLSTNIDILTLIKCQLTGYGKITSMTTAGNERIQ